MSEREFPFCNEEKCFACRNNRCTILTEALDPCSFFKTKEEEREEVIKAYRRLTSKGYNVKREFPVLYSEYKKVCSRNMKFNLDLAPTIIEAEEGE